MKIPSCNRLSNASLLIHSPYYREAHSGCLKSAFKLIDNLIIDYSRFKYFTCFIAPVQKENGNCIPLALATRICQNSMATLHDKLYLTNHREGNSMMERMMFEPIFKGEVMIGNYILVDDVFTTGITLKGLKTFIEDAGGNVISVYTIGSSKHGTEFEASRIKIKLLLSRFPNVENYFNIEQLTIAQIDYLLKFNTMYNFFRHQRNILMFKNFY